MPVERQPLPAKEARALSRLALFAKGKKERKRILWPDSDIPLLVQVLTCSEVQECHASAEARFRDLKITITTTNAYSASLLEDEIMTQILFRACRDVEQPESVTFAADCDDLRDNTTIDQRNWVYQHYCDLQRSINPDIKDLTPQIMNEIGDALKKKDSNSLSAYGSTMLASYMLSLVSPPLTSQNGNSASGLQ